MPKPKGKGKKGNNGNTGKANPPPPPPPAAPVGDFIHIQLNDEDIKTKLRPILMNPELLEHSIQETLNEFLTVCPDELTIYHGCKNIGTILSEECRPNYKLMIVAYAVIIGAFGKGPGAFISNPFADFMRPTMSSSDPEISRLIFKILSRFVASSPESCIWTDKACDVISAFARSDDEEIAMDFPQLARLAPLSEDDSNLMRTYYIRNSENTTARDVKCDCEIFDEEDNLKAVMLAEHLSVACQAPSFQNFYCPNTCPNCSDTSPILSLKPHLLCPPLYNGESENEMCWLNPLDPSIFGVQIDPSLSLNNKREKGACEQLIQTAFNEALSLNQRQIVLNELKLKPSIVRSLGVTVELLPKLVENNPLIAIDVLLKLMESGEDMKPYLTALIHMEMSVHSMDVVNRLATSVGLPKEFLYLYISNCIKTCEEIPDKYIQNRLVRLLCVFLQSSIRSQIINFQDVYIEILTFCVEFSRMREAAGLFRLMKQVESEDPELHQVLHKKLESHQLLSEAAEKFSSRDKDAK